MVAKEMLRPSWRRERRRPGPRARQKRRRYGRVSSGGGVVYGDRSPAKGVCRAGQAGRRPRLQRPVGQRGTRRRPGVCRGDCAGDLPDPGRDQYRQYLFSPSLSGGHDGLDDCRAVRRPSGAGAGGEPSAADRIAGDEDGPAPGLYAFLRPDAQEGADRRVDRRIFSTPCVPTPRSGICGLGDGRDRCGRR